ncbi:Maf family protein [Thalassoglobus polymorphus]|uniref:Nucleoside triphosphate pyrophosphatase n=1 Tax=Thalassoglobus polymorphus TaxID=2527994 RepID=A0A517QS31_9PLAN|nr:Maf family protein [Thalassoglobus polymorphus]QDT34436.1 Maf-like protein YhdE [Thalassoglobus polymorphus]
MNSPTTIILGSQSPQRRSLLQTLLSEDRIEVVPPLQSQEAGFDGLTHIDAIRERLQQIVATKNADVLQQCEFQQCNLQEWGVVLTADTVVVANDADSSFVLGKPDGPDWQATVQNWFTNFYSSKSHQVLTAVSFRFQDGTSETLLASTTVHFREVCPKLLDWYIRTEEPLGKAGGYGIQSGGSLFVESIEGSLSNVIGLPLEEVWSVLDAHQFMGLPE